ncbi:DUF2974 domain-containing protein [Campylobacter sp. JMF_01 NE2]|uniref:Mbeg1-like protein n=1 Tax=unclassified Campylobacter TaxID=2593542 RepID=UPI0022E9C4DB|nr:MULTISPECIES: Mbeg1-like protein [unclassified Campylobacter]MDA3052325.1 DUF2974 domain-containing protein [Campylobacter sp. JMF_03 NE3]MDA3066659.1 DUF2974 domain-containing protein [Campylobacter sp. JMF_01 NE2]
MANINDYLFWRGDLKFGIGCEFNELDALVLARFSYLPFHKISFTPNSSIGKICQNLQNLSDSEFLWDGDKDLAINLAKSERFGDLIVSDFQRNNDKEAISQFGAVCIHTDIDEVFISYLGTDNSILGWQEDFNMAFMRDLPCQILGAQYLEKIASKYPQKRLKIAGHSKGGNVAIYASLLAPKNIQERICKVYNYDGPGFWDKFYEQNSNAEILGKIQTYIPQKSIIGNLFSHKESVKIVQSRARGLLQHDIFTWEVGKNDFIYVPNLTRTSEIIDETLSQFLRTTSPFSRKIAIEAVFEMLNSTNAQTFVEIPQNLSANLTQILKKYGEIPKEDKKMIAKMLGKILRSYIKVSRQNLKTKIKNLK